MKLLAALFAAGKLGKLLTTGGTMLLSVFAYGLVYGLPYAAGFVALILLHELGHYGAARQRGLKVGAPTFIPFVGAWIELKDQPHDAETEAYVGFAGPLAGSLAALCCYFLARSQESQLLLALAYAGFFLNLFNLIPLSLFDGGRITAVLSPRLWLLGVPILVGLFFYRPSPMLILVAVLAAPQVLKAWRFDPAAPENAAYYRASAETRLTYGTYYLGLTAFLAVMTSEVHDLLGAPRIQARPGRGCGDWSIAADRGTIAPHVHPRAFMDNLIKDTATLELAAWLDPGTELPGWDILKGSPFGATLAAPEGGEPTPGDQLVTVQNYFAEYHLEYFRQRRYNHFPSRLHALILFATRTDAMTFRSKHPERVFGKDLVLAKTKGAYICSFHDASWLDYLRLPHSLSLAALDEVAEHYWSGRTVEEIGLTFMDEPWPEPPVIEGLFQGTLEPVWVPPRSGFLPGFA